MSLEVRERKAKDAITILDLYGTLDVKTTPILRVKLESMTKFGNHKIILNMNKVDLIDSTGIGLLMYGLKLVNPISGDMKIVGLSDQNKNIFSVLELDKVFNINQTEEQAIRSFLDDGATIH